jgi:hypothetical protein
MQEETKADVPSQEMCAFVKTAVRSTFTGEIVIKVVAGEPKALYKIPESEYPK